jgi:hypothetical protein
VAFIKITPVMKLAMKTSGGYREKDIVNHAKCAVIGKNQRYVKVFRKPDRYGETKTAVFDMKTCSWKG